MEHQLGPGASPVGSRPTLCGRFGGVWALDCSCTHSLTPSGFRARARRVGSAGRAPQRFPSWLPEAQATPRACRRLVALSAMARRVCSASSWPGLPTARRHARNHAGLSIVECARSTSSPPKPCADLQCNGTAYRRHSPGTPWTFTPAQSAVRGDDISGVHWVTRGAPLSRLSR